MPVVHIITQANWLARGGRQSPMSKHPIKPRDRRRRVSRAEERQNLLQRYLKLRAEAMRLGILKIPERRADQQGQGTASFPTGAAPTTNKKDTKHS
jgi:hypothetical protein